MRSVITRVEALKQQPGVWTASVLPGFPFSDVDRLGFTVYVAADEDASELAHDLAKHIWTRRTEFTSTLLDPFEAVQIASNGPSPVILVDVGDNVGGGSPGDGTALLSAMIATGGSGGLIVLWDPSTVHQLYARDDDVVVAAVGGRSSTALGPPVPVRGNVRRHGRVMYERTGSYMRGQRVDMGRVATIETPPATIVLTENRVVPFDDDHLRVLGLSPPAFRMVVAKGAIAWKAAFGEYARHVIYTRTPGHCPGDLHQLAFTVRPAPIFPLEPEAEWSSV